MGYDYCSVMHYPTVNSDGCRIVPKKEFKCTINGKNVEDIGENRGLSKLDKKEINKRYNCKSKFSVLVFVILS